MAAVEVQCAGCGETLEVDHGTTQFACPDCATAQRLPPELMPPPSPRPRRAIPLPPAGGRAAAAMAHDRLLCGFCGAMLSIPPDLASFACPICGEAGRRPQAAACLAALAVAQPLLPEPEVLKDPQSHAGQVHLERYKTPICTDPSQGWHPNYSSYRDEPFSSLSGGKRVPVHGVAAHGEPYNTSGHVHNSGQSPLPWTTTGPNKRKSRVESSFVDYVQANCPIHAILGLRAQRGSTDNIVDTHHSDHSQGGLPSDVTSRQGKQKTAVAPSIDGKEQIEPSNHQDAHEQQADGASILGVHAEQLQVNTGRKTAERKQKKKRSKQSTGGNHKRFPSMTPTTKEMLQLRCSNRLAKRPTVPIDTEPTQLLNSSPNQNLSEHQDVTSIIASVTPSSPLQQPVHEARCNKLDDDCESTLPLSSNHATLQAECITNFSVEFSPHEVTRTLPSGVSASQPNVPAGAVCQSSKKRKVSAQSLKRCKGHGPSKRTEPCREFDRMNCKLKQVAKRVNKANCSITFQRSDEEEDERREKENENDERGEDHENGEKDESEGGNEDELEFVRRQTRRSHVVAPPTVPAREEDKILIKPHGDSSWLDNSFDGRGHKRQVNAVLGNLVRLHNPGVVVNNFGQAMACTTWKDFAIAPDDRHVNAQGVVKNEFWKRFRVDPDDKENAHRVLEANAKKVVRDMMSNVRLQATNAFMKSRGVIVNDFREYSSTFLTADEYAQVQLPCYEGRPDAYRALCQLWSSKEFQEKSQKKRNSGVKSGKHTFGGDGYVRMAQRMEAQSGAPPAPIDLYRRGHRGPDPQHLDVLCSQVATERMAQYGQEMIKRHGKCYNWQKEPIDPVAVHASGGGKSHGRYSMFNGMIDSAEVRAQMGSSSQSSGGSSRRRRTKKEIANERLEQRLKAQEEYNIQMHNYFASYAAQQQQMFQTWAQEQGCTIPFPPWQPPPRPQFDPIPPTRSASAEPLSGTDFVTNLFACEGRGHNSNDPPNM